MKKQIQQDEIIVNVRLNFIRNEKLFWHKNNIVRIKSIVESMLNYPITYNLIENALNSNGKIATVHDSVVFKEFVETIFDGYTVETHNVIIYQINQLMLPKSVFVQNDHMFWGRWVSEKPFSHYDGVVYESYGSVVADAHRNLIRNINKDFVFNTVH
jgi:hypothetical protein